MSKYIETLNRSLAESDSSSMASVKIDLSSLAGYDWIDVMDDPSAIWQKEYLTEEVLKLSADAIWEIDGQFFSVEFLLGDSEQPDSQRFIEIFDQCVRASPDQRRMNLESLVQLAGESVLSL